jgi:hypothetical protein
MSENSEKILKGILEKQEVIEKLLILLIPNLKTKKGVANFFGVTDRTIDNWKDNGKFEENIEYFIDLEGKTIFLPLGILNHNNKINNKNSKSIEKIKNEIYHPSVANIIKGLNFG